MSKREYKYEFHSALPEYAIERALELIEFIDSLATGLQQNSLPVLPSAHIQELINTGPNSAEGWKIFNQMKVKFDSVGYKATKSELEEMLSFMIMLIAHHAVHAILAETEEESSWHYGRGQYLVGATDFLIWGGDDAVVMAAKGRDGARVTNSIYDQTKLKVFAWCDDHRNEYRSAEAAAREVNEKFGVSVDTAKKYFKEHKLKNQLTKNQ